MLELNDPQLRLGLLNVLAIEVANRGPRNLSISGLQDGQLSLLAAMPASELRKLASMKAISFTVTVDGKALSQGVDAVMRSQHLRGLTDYFVLHGASCQLMHRLFRMSRKMTHRRRIELDARRAPGRQSLPDFRTREQICIEWTCLSGEILRMRYYRLHQKFPDFSLAALDATVHEKEIEA